MVYSAVVDRDLTLFMMTETGFSLILEAITTPEIVKYFWFIILVSTVVLNWKMYLQGLNLCLFLILKSFHSYLVI